MNKTVLILALIIIAFTTGCLTTGKITAEKTAMTENKNQFTTACCDGCKADSKAVEISCKLMSPELQKRKETVLASLKRQILEKKELENGFAFKFPGTDAVLDELTEFIKTERECCGFFTFGLSVSGDKGEAWFELTGPKGSKDFITEELGL